MTLRKLCASLVLSALTLTVYAESGLWVRPAPGQVPSVQLGWDYNSVAEPSVVGFWIYQGGSSGNYTNRIQFPGSATRTATVTNVPSGKTFYFACTAYTTDGLESEFSNELAFRKPGPPILNATQMRGLFVKIAGIGTPNTLYAFERTEDLKNWETWELAQADSDGNVELLQMPFIGQSFYRIKEFP